MVALQQLHQGLAETQPQRPTFAYVASGEGLLHVFSLRDAVWSRIQCVPSRAPACILLSPAQRTLYVANEVDVHEGLPRGSVEAFNIDPGDGRLTLLGRQPLSLSATRPRHMALSPDGKLLAVAAYGGGLYNLLPIGEDGSIGRPSGIYKEAGCGRHAELQGSAHPHTLVFDPTGRHLLSSDFGSDRLSVFAVEDGRLRRRMQEFTGEGSGPGACALHHAGTTFYAWHDLENTLVCYRYDAASGTVGEMIQRLSFPKAAGSVATNQALALHPSGRILYTTQVTRNQLSAWRIDAGSGMLSRAQHVLLGETTRITVAPDGKSVFVLDGASGSICRVTADPLTGELGWKTKVALVHEPRSLALKTIFPGSALLSHPHA
jgi:6-phosphogluconolactonase (cycloisomerase 2 family)